MPRALDVEQHLGYRILRWMLATAVLCGVLVSSVQVVRDAATQSVFSIDDILARQVIDGLLALKSIHLARITHPTGEELGSRVRPLRDNAFRPVTDPIFGAVREYREGLSRSASPNTVYGYLEIHFDTAPLAATWLTRAAVTFASGIALALILGLIMFVVFHLLLTSPLLRIVHSVKKVDPEKPDDCLIALPKGHRSDELGLWVNATNNLLVGIGNSQKRHREAEDRVNKLSRFDQLTGLPSRDTFLDSLRDEIIIAQKNNRILALMVCGIDDFKSVNDQCGFRTGDII